MITFRALYFDGTSSKAHGASVASNGNFLQVRLDERDAFFSFQLADCAVSPPLGKTSRSISLPGGGRIETADFEAVARLESYAGVNPGMRLVHFLERNWKATAVSLLGLAVFVWAFITFGVPLAAKKIASAVPPGLSEEVSRQTVALLDSRFTKPSELPPKRIAELQAVFEEVTKTAPGGFKYRLEFRASPALGPNAFALPSGTIIMTDELVKLSKDNKELAGVLRHEVSHVERRHGLRSVIQNAGVFVLISALAGDIASITSAAGSLPTLLAQSRYSREFEREADKDAAAYFVHRGWSTKPLRDILLRISEHAPDYPGESLLSSHPLTEERVKYLQELEKATAGRYN